MQLLQDEGTAGRLSLDGLLAARRGEELVGACWCQVAPGRLATIWPPVIAGDEADKLAMALMSAAVTVAVSRDAKLAKALVLDPNGPDAEWYRRSGFRHLTDRIEMSRTVDRAAASASTTPLEFESYSPAAHARLERIVERSYIDSHDCPQLNGLRDANEVLESYRALGEFRADRWFIARHEQLDVGCAIVTDYPREEQCELLYMGLAPEHRGQGWGISLVRNATSLARAIGRDRLVLAVDAQNQPALKTYLAAGFVEVERQAVMIRVLA